MIYLDSASTMPVCEAAKKVILDNIDEYYNPSSAYEPSRQVRIKVEQARENIAEMIGASEPEEIIFTSGGSEANALALNGYTYLASCIEHSSIKYSSVIHNHNKLINKLGVVDLEAFNNVIKNIASNYGLSTVTLMYVNNETGVIQPISDVAKEAHECNAVFHSDMVQAAPHIKINVEELGVDTASFSGHKWGALKGCGFLYVKDGIALEPIIRGVQENSLRGSTTNTLGILTMEAALRDTVDHMTERNEYVRKLRDRLLDALLEIPGSHLNGSLTNRIDSNINIRFDDIDNQMLLTGLESFSILASAGSACHAGENTPSAVLKAMGLSNKEANESIRLTLSHYNTSEEIDDCINIFPKLIKELRR